MSAILVIITIITTTIIGDGSSSVQLILFL